VRLALGAAVDPAGGYFRADDERLGFSGDFKDRDRPGGRPVAGRQGEDRDHAGRGADFRVTGRVNDPLVVLVEAGRAQDEHAFTGNRRAAVFEGRLARRGAASALILLASLLAVPSTPAAPGVPAEPTSVYLENFENSGNEALLVNAYQGAAVAQNEAYTAAAGLQRLGD
jgi:hypothetical protein